MLERVPDLEETVGVRCTQREDRSGEELAPVRMKYGHRDQQDAHAFSTAALTREDGGWKNSTSR